MGKTPAWIVQKGQQTVPGVMPITSRSVAATVRLIAMSVKRERMVSPRFRMENVQGRILGEIIIMEVKLKARFYITLLLLAVLSCSEDDEDCGCDGSTRRVLENLKARYVGEGIFIVPDTLAGYLKVYPCDVDTDWEISKDENTWNYTISGNLKKNCLGRNPEFALPSAGGKIQLTNIRKM